MNDVVAITERLSCVNLNGLDHQKHRTPCRTTVRNATLLGVPNGMGGHRLRCLALMVKTQQIDVLERQKESSMLPDDQKIHNLLDQLNKLSGYKLCHALLDLSDAELFEVLGSMCDDCRDKMLDRMSAANLMAIANRIDAAKGVQHVTG